MNQERRVKHEYFSAPNELLRSQPGSWFHKHGLAIPGAIFANPDIRASRLMIASMLIEAWDKNLFFQENGHLEPKPSESDRMSMIAFLQQIASSTGLINGEEIRMIQNTERPISLERFRLKEPILSNFNKVAGQVRDWKWKGDKIGLFQGSFDPPTAIHLSCATEAYNQCDRLIIGFDNDALLRKRKGKDRPRFPLINRRKTFESFWMVDTTYVTGAKDETDIDQYAFEYLALGVDYVFLANNQKDLSSRLDKIRMGGAKPKYLGYQNREFSATRTLELAKQWGFI